MAITIEYDQNDVEVKIPPGNLLEVVKPTACRTLGRGEFLCQLEETSSDTDYESFFSKIIRERGELLIIINDANRPTPSFAVMDALATFINRVKKKRLSVATGSHTPPSDKELRDLIGSQYPLFEGRIHIHKARDEGAHIEVGTTTRGTPVRFDKIVCDARNILVIGSVEPHYFAGFTGGRKAFLPGHASYETIEHNHSFALRKGARLLDLANNPVHLDMVEACGLLEGKNIYSIQLVVDGNANIARAFGGDLNSSFQAAIPACREIFTVEIEERADVVLSVAEYPMDISLYQSQKAMENAKSALKRGGVLILVSATRSGLGPPVFADLLKSSEDLDEIMGEIRANYVLGYQKTAKFIEAIKDFSVLLVTGLLPDEVRSLHMTPVGSVQGAVDRALGIAGEEAKILVMPRGSALVPSIVE